jgi:hypothetical protein
MRFSLIDNSKIDKAKFISIFELLIELKVDLKQTKIKNIRTRENQIKSEEWNIKTSRSFFKLIS